MNDHLSCSPNLITITDVTFETLSIGLMITYNKLKLKITIVLGSKFLKNLLT